MRLIDADNLIPMIRYATIDSEVGIFPILIGFDAIKKVVDEAPTIDAEPVRHGKWIVDAEDCRHQIEWFKCSQCDFPTSTAYKYCPNCGARMDGERKEDG